jgi:hypothetical protein
VQLPREVPPTGSTQVGIGVHSAGENKVHTLQRTSMLRTFRTASELHSFPTIQCLTYSCTLPISSSSQTPSHPLPSYPIPHHLIPSPTILSHPPASYPIPNHPISSPTILYHPQPSYLITMSSHIILSHPTPSYPIPHHPIPSQTSPLLLQYTEQRHVQHLGPGCRHQ